jgi:hypothetical protein
MARRYNEFQSGYLKAKAEFDQAESAFKAEVAAAGIEKAIESTPEGPALDALSEALDVIAARWRVSDLRKAMWAAETALIDWALNLTVRLRPSSADDVAALRLRIHKVKPEIIKLALNLPA